MICKLGVVQEPESQMPSTIAAAAAKQRQRQRQRHERQQIGGHDVDDAASQEAETLAQSSDVI